MCHSRDEVFKVALARATMLELPSIWSSFPCHPGWCSVPWDQAYADLAAQFASRELVEAGFAVEVNGELQPSAAVPTRSAPTFVVRSGPSASPSAILPAGNSLDGKPAWQHFFSDFRACPLVRKHQPLLLGAPEDVPTLMSLGHLAAPAPAVEEMNADFLQAIFTSLPIPADRSRLNPLVVFVGWEVSACCTRSPAVHHDRLEHVRRLVQHFDPDISFESWQPSDEWLEHLQFVSHHGTSQHLADAVNDSLGEDKFSVLGPNQTPPKQRFADPIGNYIKATTGRLSPQERHQLRIKCIKKLRAMALAAIEETRQFDPTERWLRMVAIETVWLAHLDVLEAVAQSLDGRARGPGDPPPRSVAQAIRGIERAVKLVRESGPPKPTLPQLLRAVA